MSNYVYVSREQVFSYFFIFLYNFLVVALMLAVAASIESTCTKYTFLSRTLNLPPPSPSDYTACTPPFFNILFRFTARVIPGSAMKAFLKDSTTPRKCLIFKKGGTEVWAKNSAEVQQQQTDAACDLQFEHLTGVVVITAFRKWNSKLELSIKFSWKGERLSLADQKCYCGVCKLSSSIVVSK